MISSKVDVWSIGIIYFFLLYGEKPFGNKLNAKEFKSQVLEKIKELIFPEKPMVSNKTKNFIKSCLTNNVD